MQTDYERYIKMSSLAQIGWWEADFEAGHYLCSDFLCDLLGLEGDTISFSDFQKLIREDYREQIVQEFRANANIHRDFYEQTFPVRSRYGEVWLHTRLAHREKGTGSHGGDKSFGVIQRVEAPKESEQRDALLKVNNLLRRQNFISQSLLRFLHDEEMESCVTEILNDILNLYYGEGRVYIFEYDKNHTHQSCTYEVVSEGVSSEKGSQQSLPIDQSRWWSRQILSGTPILLNSLKQLPEEAEEEYKFLDAQGILSMMVTPLRAGDHIWGYMGIDLVGTYHEWSNEDYQWFSSLANIISICIELRKANRAMDRSEKLFRSIFANIPAGVEIYDKDGYLTDMNNMNLEIFGVVNKEEALGINFFENPNVPQAIRDRVKNEDLVDFRLNYSFERAEGYYHSSLSNTIDIYTKVSKLYDNEGNFNGYILISIDNTERLDALNRIRDFENFFLLISDYAKVGYAKLNLISRKGYAIKQWYKNMGEDEDTPLSEVVGIYRQVHPDDRQSILDFFEEVKKGNRHHFQKEMRVRRLGTADQWNWVRTNIVVTTYEPENNEIELIGINYDITELKETEAELILARDKAEMMDRLKSAFLANMSHEIRTPLNAIVGFSDVIGSTYDELSEEERADFVRLISINSEHLVRLIDDILDLSKIESNTIKFTYSNYSLKSIMKDIEKEQVVKNVPEIEIKAILPDDDIYITTDATRLKQVICNFINNARKFTEEGYIHFGFMVNPENDDSVCLFVEDTGEGIPQECQKEIFDRFYKVNTFKQGTGLGLSICKTIVEHLQGSIYVVSEVGRGSRFTVTLPLEKQPVEA